MLEQDIITELSLGCVKTVCPNYIKKRQRLFDRLVKLKNLEILDFYPQTSHIETISTFII